MLRAEWEGVWCRRCEESPEPCRLNGCTPVHTPSAPACCCWFASAGWFVLRAASSCARRARAEARCVAEGGAAPDCVAALLPPLCSMLLSLLLFPLFLLRVPRSPLCLSASV